MPIPGVESSDDDWSAYEADAQPKAGEVDNILSRITRLTNEAKKAAKSVAKAQDELKKAQDNWRQLVEFQLPEAMQEAKQEKLKTADGDEVELKETLYASIPKANLPKAIMWLTSNNQGSIVKRKMELGFGKEEDQQAARCLSMLLEEGFTPTDVQSVHPQTLAATLRELISQGVEVDMALMGAHIRKEVKIKGVKVTKASDS